MIVLEKCRAVKSMRLRAVSRSLAAFCICWASIGVSTAQTGPNTFKHSDGDLWTIKPLATQLTSSPNDNKDEYAILFISQREDGSWKINGNLSGPETVEMIYIDRRLRQIGPFTADRAKCSMSKAAALKAQRKAGTYNSCRSSFFTADGGEKMAQALLACALIACIGGASEGWTAVFRPISFKNAISSPGVMEAIENHFRYYDNKIFAENSEPGEAKFQAQVKSLRKELEKIDEEGGDSIDSLRANLNTVSVLETRLDEDLKGLMGKQRKTPGYWGFRNTTNLNPNYSFLRELVERIERSYTDASKEIANVKERMGAKLKDLETIEKGWVRKIQESLSSLGYYDASIDGEFGSNTGNAVESFLKDSGTDVATTDKKRLYGKIDQLKLSGGARCSGASQTKYRYGACLTATN
jgi:hypothetical protein